MQRAFHKLLMQKRYWLQNMAHNPKVAGSDHDLRIPDISHKSTCQTMPSMPFLDRIIRDDGIVPGLGSQTPLAVVNTPPDRDFVTCSSP